LRPGDRLSRAEFHRRYERSALKKAELVEGVVHVPSPARLEHGDAHLLVATWIGTYRARTPGTLAYSEATLVLDDENEVQPDAILARTGGGLQARPDGYLTGAPDLVVEVALSSTSYDLGGKREVYRRHGVCEYLVLALGERRLHAFELRDGRHVARSAGVWRSSVFPGLDLDVAAVLRGDAAGVLACLERGLGSRP
jgi:Uma2 family endonuclease